jgi:hypothetical protein
MRPHSRQLMLTCLTMLAINSVIRAKEPPLDPTDVGQVRSYLRKGCQDGLIAVTSNEHLVRMGEKVFAAYEAILSDPKSTSDEIGRAFCVLSDIEADRRRFAKHAVMHLTDADFGSRLNAVNFLGKIGSAADASPVVALLSDRDISLVYAAARTLAAIGDPNEVVAMDVWLRGVCHRDKDAQKAVQYHRDKLKKRLEEDKDPKKRAQKIQKCWRDLRVTEYRYPKLGRAVWTLTAFGNESVTFLKDRVRPVAAETQKRFDQLVADLDSDSFDRREAATRELSCGVVAEAVLEKALANRPSPEMRRRLEPMLENYLDWTEKDPEVLRSIRAIWVLQQIGTSEARALLEKIAAGAPSAALTQKAKDALQSLDRLKKR